MSLLRLIGLELLHRRWSSLALVAVMALAAGSVSSQLLLLQEHARRTEELLAQKDRELKAMMVRLEDDFRKITLKLGFNLLILPEGMHPADLYDPQATPRFMPEEYASRLANSKLATINHVLPTLTRPIEWPEIGRRIVLAGVPGEVYIQSAGQKPLQARIAAGEMMVGHELWRGGKLKVGDNVQLLGRSFRIATLLPEKGNWDDLTAWIDLPAAQEMLGKKGEINVIMALECSCTPDRLAKIRAEIGSLMPGTQILELTSSAIARAEARSRAAEQAEASIRHEQAYQARLLQQRESFAAMVIPAAIGVAGAMTLTLMMLNVRQRRYEIGLLRAIGFRRRQILALFLGKALAVAALGAALGLAGGLCAAPGAAVGRIVWLWTPLGMLGVSLLAAWLPALMASQEEPAPLLQE
ncbi:MAG: ABC transporter permease [bacterium]